MPSNTGIAGDIPRTGRPALLHAMVGTRRLLARPGGRRLWLLDDAGSALWDLWAAGWDPGPLTNLVAERFQLNPTAARACLDDHFRHWLASGLLDDDAAMVQLDPVEPLSAFPPPRAAPPAPGLWRLRLGDRRVELAISDAACRHGLRPLLAPLRLNPHDAASHAQDRGRPVRAIDRLTLEGGAGAWSLRVNDAELASGRGQDMALVAVLHALTEAGCRTGERLLVVHGAGLVAPGGTAYLLIAPGGSGKTTLAAALSAAGHELLSDDVVPVTPSGELIGLGLPLCLKPGSWPLLQVLPGLSGCTRQVARHGQTVRFLPAPRPWQGRPRPPALFLFPRYAPHQPPRQVSLPPEQVLRGLIEAEAVIREMTQDKLERLAAWVASAPAWSLSYPDLDTGLAVVGQLLADRAAAWAP